MYFLHYSFFSQV